MAKKLLCVKYALFFSGILECCRSCGLKTSVYSKIRCWHGAPYIEHTVIGLNTVLSNGVARNEYVTSNLHLAMSTRRW